MKSFTGYLVSAALVLIGLGGLFAADVPVDDPVPAGARVELSATADGNPAPTFEWFRNGTKVGSGPTYIIAAMSVDAEGDYTARATNYLGSATSPVHRLKLGGAVPGNVVVTVKVTTGGSAGDNPTRATSSSTVAPAPKK